MDTMSLHMAISGLTGFQRTLWIANKMGKKRGLQEVKKHIEKTGQKREGLTVCNIMATIRSNDPVLTAELIASWCFCTQIGSWDWVNISSINNLADVHALYVGGPPLQKEARETFVKGSLRDVRNNFQVRGFCLIDHGPPNLRHPHAI